MCMCVWEWLPEDVCVSVNKTDWLSEHRGNTDWVKTTFFSKDLSRKNLVQIFVVLLFLHNRTQTHVLSCVFFMYLTSPPLFFWIFWSPLQFFFSSERTQRLWIITLNKDTILEDLDCWGILILLDWISNGASQMMNYCCKSPSPPHQCVIMYPCSPSWFFKALGF